MWFAASSLGSFRNLGALAKGKSVPALILFPVLGRQVNMMCRDLKKNIHKKKFRG